MKWISVKDGLPKHGAHVLVFKNLGKTVHALACPLIGCPFEICEFGTYGNGGFCNRDGRELSSVTYWMPLPEFPIDN